MSGVPLRHLLILIGVWRLPMRITEAAENGLTWSPMHATGISAGATYAILTMEHTHRARQSGAETSAGTFRGPPSEDASGRPWAWAVVHVGGDRRPADVPDRRRLCGPPAAGRGRAAESSVEDLPGVRARQNPGEPIVGILTFIWHGYKSGWTQDTGTVHPGVRDAARRLALRPSRRDRPRGAVIVAARPTL